MYSIILQRFYLFTTFVHQQFSYVESILYLMNALVFLPPAVQGVKLWITHNVINLLKREKKEIT